MSLARIRSTLSRRLIQLLVQNSWFWIDQTLFSNPCIFDGFRFRQLNDFVVKAILIEYVVSPCWWSYIIKRLPVVHHQDVNPKQLQSCAGTSTCKNVTLRSTVIADLHSLCRKTVLTRFLNLSEPANVWSLSAIYFAPVLQTSCIFLVSFKFMAGRCGTNHIEFFLLSSCSSVQSMQTWFSSQLTWMVVSSYHCNFEFFSSLLKIKTELRLGSKCFRILYRLAIEGQPQNFTLKLSFLVP